MKGNIVTAITAAVQPRPNNLRHGRMKVTPDYWFQKARPKYGKKHINLININRTES